MAGTVHVVGAGLAGLSAAVRLAESGRRVIVHEAARHAGGRCRSYHDPALNMTIDNGNHLLLSGNTSALSFLSTIGSSSSLVGPEHAEFAFADLATGERWILRPNDGRLPWWILDATRRVPATRPADYLGAARLLFARSGATIGASMPCAGPLYERLWRPVLLAGLNTEPELASAALAATLIRETLGAGGRACRPLVARDGLSAALITPALAWLERRGAEIRFGARLKAITRDGSVATALAFGNETITLGPDDALVLAVPSWIAADLMPDLTVPGEHRAIVNAHFAVGAPADMPLLLGVVGGLTEWLFAFEGRLSVTISGADRLLDIPRESLAEDIWSEVATLAGLAGPLPPWQIVIEKRATFAATPGQDRLRPGTLTTLGNVVLAGDWTRTGLPATIEGAIRSGETAAGALDRRLRAAA